MMVITGSLERKLTLEWKDTATTTISGINTFVHIHIMDCYCFSFHNQEVNSNDFVIINMVVLFKVLFSYSSFLKFFLSSF